MKAEVRSLAAAVADGTATAEQETRLEELTAEIESRQAKAAVAARAIKAAQVADVAETTEKPAAGTWGETFVRSAEFAARTSKGKTEMVNLETRAALTTGDIYTVPARVDVMAAADKAPLQAAISTEVVSNGAVEYVVETFTNNAAFVAEGNTKPESAVAFEKKTVSLETLAHSHDVTRQALEDETRLSSIIDNRLRRGLTQKIEAHIADVIVADENIASAEGADLLSAIRVAIATVESNGYVPSVLLINPADAAELDLAILGATNAGAVRGTSFWGLNVVTSPLIPADAPYVADAATAVTLFDRGTSALYITDSDASKFRQNIITMLAETRVKAAVVVPAAIVKAVKTA